MANQVIQSCFWELLNYEELSTGKLVAHISVLFIESNKSSLFVEMVHPDLPENYSSKGG